MATEKEINSLLNHLEQHYQNLFIKANRKREEYLAKLAAGEQIDEPEPPAPMPLKEKMVVIKEKIDLLQIYDPELKDSYQTLMNLIKHKLGINENQATMPGNTKNPANTENPVSAENLTNAEMAANASNPAEAEKVNFARRWPPDISFEDVLDSKITVYSNLDKLKPQARNNPPTNPDQKESSNLNISDHPRRPGTIYSGESVINMRSSSVGLIIQKLANNNDEYAAALKEKHFEKNYFLDGDHPIGRGAVRKRSTESQNQKVDREFNRKKGEFLQNFERENQSPAPQPAVQQPNTNEAAGAHNPTNENQTAINASSQNVSSTANNAPAPPADNAKERVYSNPLRALGKTSRR